MRYLLCSVALGFAYAFSAWLTGSRDQVALAAGSGLVLGAIVLPLFVRPDRTVAFAGFGGFVCTLLAPVILFVAAPLLGGSSQFRFLPITLFFVALTAGPCAVVAGWVAYLLAVKLKADPTQDKSSDLGS